MPRARSSTRNNSSAKLLQGSAGAPPAGIGAPANPSPDDDYAGADPEDPDGYKALNVLPKEYAPPSLDKHRPGELIDLSGKIDFVVRAAVPGSGSAGAPPAEIGALADLPLAAESAGTRRNSEVRMQKLPPSSFLLHTCAAVPTRGNANFALSSLLPSSFILQTCAPLAPHGMAGFVLARFWLWVKHRLRRANSREETGRASCAFNATDTPWRVGLYSGRIFS